MGSPFRTACSMALQQKPAMMAPKQPGRRQRVRLNSNNECSPIIATQKNFTRDTVSFIGYDQASLFATEMDSA